MCKFNPKNDSRRIDPCMEKFIESLNAFLKEDVNILACCCGHGKYPMTIVCVDGTFPSNWLKEGKNKIFDLVSDTWIPRQKRFYKKDKQGYYYIPEVLTHLSSQEKQ